MQILEFAPLRDVRFGSKADMGSAKRQAADICSAPAHVRFVPIADIRRHLFNHLVGAVEHRGSRVLDMLWWNPSSSNGTWVDLCRTANNLVSLIPVTQPSIARHASVRYPMAADNEASLGSSGQ
jgi:hypothetical protein